MSDKQLKLNKKASGIACKIAHQLKVREEEVPTLALLHFEKALEKKDPVKYGFRHSLRVYFTGRVWNHFCKEKDMQQSISDFLDRSISDVQMQVFQD